MRDKFSDKNYNYEMGTLSALGIIFVVCGHLDTSVFSLGSIFAYYSFHMNLFLFISGYFFNRDCIQSFPGKYILKKVKTLLVPFFAWNLVYLIFQTILNVAFGFHLGNNLTLYNLFIYPVTHNQPSGFNIASWFILALFTVELLNCILRWVLHYIFKWNPKINELIVLVLYGIISVAAFILIRNEVANTELAVNGLRSLYLLFFYQLGQVYKTFETEIDKINGYLWFAVVIVLKVMMIYKYGRTSFEIYGCYDFSSFVIVFLHRF